MDNIRQWIMIICISSVATAVLYFVLPSGTMQKSFRTVISLFILVIIVYPLSGEKISDFFNIRLDETHMSSTVENTDSFMNAAVEDGEQVVKNGIEQYLSSVCADEFNVDVTMQLNESNEAVLTEVSIGVSESDFTYSQVIKEYVKNNIGVVPIVNGK